MFLICGPKCSICCTLLSAWALIMLPIMGGLFYVQSLAFVEDFGEPEGHGNFSATPEEAAEWYHERTQDAAFNCWVATAIYAGTFLLSLHQWYYNFRQAKI